MAKKNIFTSEEQEYMINNWDKESIHSMKKRFNSTWHSIALFASENNLKLPKSNEWNEEEIINIQVF